MEKEVERIYYTSAKRRERDEEGWETKSDREQEGLSVFHVGDVGKSLKRLETIGKLTTDV